MSPQIHRSGFIYHGRFEKHWNLQFSNYLFFCCKQSCSFLNTLITYFPRFDWNFEAEEIFADDLCLCDQKIWWDCPRPHLLSHGWSAKCQPASFHKSIGNTKSWRKNLERNCESLNLGLVHSIEGKVQHLNMAGQQYVSQHLSKNQSEEQTGEELVKKLGKELGKFTFRTRTQHWGEKNVLNSSFMCVQYNWLKAMDGQQYVSHHLSTNQSEEQVGEDLEKELG